MLGCCQALFIVRQPEQASRQINQQGNYSAIDSFTTNSPPMYSLHLIDTYNRMFEIGYVDSDAECSKLNGLIEKIFELFCLSLLDPRKQGVE